MEIIKYLKAFFDYSRYVKYMQSEGETVIVSRKLYAKRNWKNII